MKSNVFQFDFCSFLVWCYGYSPLLILPLRNPCSHRHLTHSRSFYFSTSGLQEVAVHIRSLTASTSLSQPSYLERERGREWKRTAESKLKVAPGLYISPYPRGILGFWFSLSPFLGKGQELFLLLLLLLCLPFLPFPRNCSSYQGSREAQCSGRKKGFAYRPGEYIFSHRGAASIEDGPLFPSLPLKHFD